MKDSPAAPSPGDSHDDRIRRDVHTFEEPHYEHQVPLYPMYTNEEWMERQYSASLEEQNLAWNEDIDCEFYQPAHEDWGPAEYDVWERERERERERVRERDRDRRRSRSRSPQGRSSEFDRHQESARDQWLSPISPAYIDEVMFDLIDYLSLEEEEQRCSLPIDSGSLQRKAVRLRIYPAISRLPRPSIEISSTGRSGAQPLDIYLEQLGKARVLQTELINILGVKKVMVIALNKDQLLELKSLLYGSRTFHKRLPEITLDISSPEGKKSRSDPDILDLCLKADDIQALLSAPSTKQKKLSEKGSEIDSILNKKTSLQIALQEKFQSKGGSTMQEFCRYGTRDQCAAARSSKQDFTMCLKVHFRRVLLPHTDISLGDCSYLDTCRHMAACKFVHYEIDGNDIMLHNRHHPIMHIPARGGILGPRLKEVHQIVDEKSDSGVPTQWLNCDVRTFDFSILGQFDVVMADPPWDIHMDLPYGTMTDDEMRYKLPINKLQENNGLIFLWVTGRAMELGRELFALWGYKQVDELLWVKTNQLQRIIRTGRTGHWLNHSKEHCLIGMKGDVKLNRNLDCDVLVSEVRETSRKPDEIYELIERMSPGTRKIEIFGRKHNIWPGWFTIGNQLPKSKIVEKDIIERYNKTYPDNPYEESSDDMIDDNSSSLNGDASEAGTNKSAGL